MLYKYLRFLKARLQHLHDIMNIFQSGTTKILRNFKVFMPCLLQKQYSLVEKKTLFLTSCRSISCEGIYTSISFSTPVLSMQDTLINLHNYTGLPWWAVITLATFGIRSAIVLPLAIHQSQVIARLANLNAELNKISPEMNKEVNIGAKMFGWNEVTARKIYRKNMKQQYWKLVIRDNCHPFKIVLLALIQIPAWIIFSISLRNLSFSVHKDLHEQFSTEGTLWFTDLTQPDMIFIPILLTAVNLFIIEINALRQINTSSTFQKYLLHFMRATSVIVGAVAIINPASVSYYWLCSSTFGAAQNIFLMFPKVRHVLRIPKVPNESTTPFIDIISNFRKRFHL